MREGQPAIFNEIRYSHFYKNACSFYRARLNYRCVWRQASERPHAPAKYTSLGTQDATGQIQCSPAKYANKVHVPTVFLMVQHDFLGNSDAERKQHYPPNGESQMHNAHPQEPAAFSILRSDNTDTKPPNAPETQPCTTVTHTTSNSHKRLPKDANPTPNPAPKSMNTSPPDYRDGITTFMSLSPIEDALLRETFIGRFTL